MRLRNKRTGDIWEFDGGFSMKASQETAERAGAISGSLACFANSLAELNEEWEDYEPKEPLIKDEKIRKVVRAWAEVNLIKEVLYAGRPNRSLCNLTDMGDDDSGIEFVGWIPTLKDGEIYTIAELCGEDEDEA